MEERLTLHRVL